MKKKKTKVKAKSTVASNALYRAYNKRPAEQLNNNSHFNDTLVFAKQSALHDTYKQLQAAFIALLSSAPIPDGLIAPIASGPKREAVSKRNVETLLANLFNMKSQTSISLSLSHDHYSNTKLSGTGFINLVKLASHKSHLLLGLRAGFQDLANPKNSRNARIWPTRRFWELMESGVVNEDDIVSIPHDLINLRKTVIKNGRKQKNTVPRKIWIKDLTPEQQTWLDIIEGSLRWFNLVYGEYEMQYVSEDDNQLHYLFPSLYAVYTTDFLHGGRFYTGKGGHQNRTKKERSTITFNGHPTTEKDYSGFHIRMLHDLAGLSYPMNRCPYGAVLKEMGLNYKQLFRQFPDLKDDMKKIVFGMVNGTIKNHKNLFAQAVNRAQFQLFNNREESQKDRQERRTRWSQLNLLDSKGKPSKVIEAFMKAHKPIKDNFYSGCGLDLQNIDAEIAFWVMAEMMFSDADRCIPTLPVHDSFITFAAYENRLINVMKMVYSAVLQQQTGVSKYYEIPVK